MKNPWEEINLSDYENHMKSDKIMQLQTMNSMMKEQFYAYQVKTVMIFGIAGGNGLEHISKNIFDKVYGVDINKDYLDECKKRYPELNGTFETVHTDLLKDISNLPHSDLVIANLLIEYIGYDCFKSAVKQVNPKYVSCIIQINTDSSFVSDSPYIHAFDELDRVHSTIDENALINEMSKIGYSKTACIERALPDGKKLLRIDFKNNS